MNIVIIGLGSMGKRRLRLVKKIKPDARIIGIDSNAERANEVGNKYGIDVVDSITAALKIADVDCAIVSTSPLSHGKVINECLRNDMNVFSEINLVADLYEENIKLAGERDKVLFLSSTFLYRDEIQYIQKRVQESGCKLNYVYHVGQYLPDWHPWETYKDFFVADKRTNGCRELFAIELPWILTIFGEVEKIETFSDNLSGLDIEYRDNYMVLIKHKSGNKGMIMVDVVSRMPRRNLEVFGDPLFLAWRGDANSLIEYDHIEKKENVINLYNNVERAEGYSSFIVENAYENELKAFFNQVENGIIPAYDFEKDMYTLKIIDEIENGDY